MRVLPAGDHAVLIELPDLDSVHTLHRAVLEAGFATDAVPGWRTLLVTADAPAKRIATLVRTAHDRQRELIEPQTAPTIRIPVTYQGADLEEVAMTCGLSAASVVELHSAATYTVAFLGFSRGFPYLSGLPALLHLPRRPTPRPKVPAGSVAIALDLCGIYPQDSPGGWHLLGTTHLRLFDEHSAPPSQLQPGQEVRFEPVQS